MAASDPASGSPGAWAPVQPPFKWEPRPTAASANLAFMTYGLNAGVGPAPTESTNRNIVVGGTGVVYNSVTLGGVTNDYTAMNGSIALNEAPSHAHYFHRPQRRAGRFRRQHQRHRVGDGRQLGCRRRCHVARNDVSNNGTIVFDGANTYTGATTVSAGKLYVNGALTASSSVSVLSGATLGGKGTISGAVYVAGGALWRRANWARHPHTDRRSELQRTGTINYGAVQPTGNPPLLVTGGNGLATNGNTVTININGSIPSTGNYALIGYNGIQANQFTLPRTFPIVRRDPSQSSAATSWTST